MNVLYGNAWMNLAKGPLVLLIPPIPQRYYVMQFMDPFGQVFAYVGARATGNTGDWSPGQAKQNNWLPSPTTNKPFNMVLRLYWPDQPQALNGTWSPPPIQRANATG